MVHVFIASTFWLYFKFDKKVTQTVAFGVTSQNQLLYNAPATERCNRHKFEVKQYNPLNLFQYHLN
ncbi:hypothetical protein DC357_15555 [Vibrio vulnificus]|nr:hypothetical protein DC357_15555 [Vibrio vulnificus]